MIKTGCFLLALPVCLSASMLQVGPIHLSGHGIMYSPDQDQGLGIVLSASGSNGVDTVSIVTRDIELDGGWVPRTSFDAPIYVCATGTNLTTIMCSGNIDGITGAYTSFTAIGGGLGMLQIWSDPDNIPGHIGPVIAQAQVISYGVITSYSADPVTPWVTQGTFDLMPSQPIPEPNTYFMGWGGLAWILISVRTSQRRAPWTAELRGKIR